MAFRRHFSANGENDEETEPLYGSAILQEREKKDWNDFKNEPREPSVGSAVETKYLDMMMKTMKIVTYIITFFVVLCAAVVSKGTTLFMTSQIKKNVTRPYCKSMDKSVQFLVTLPEVERVTWIWYLVFAYSVPEVGTFIRSCRKCLFKSWKRPSWLEFFSLFVTEACPAVGSAILIFLVFPELDVIKAAMLTNAVCFVPGAVAFFSRNPKSVDSSLRMILDIVSLVAQASSFVIWPLVDDRPILYTIPIAVILISVGWWENFVTEDSCVPFIGKIGKAKKKFENKTYFLYIFMSLIKIGLFIGTMVVIYWIREDNVSFLFDNFTAAFENHKIKVDEIDPILWSETSPNYENAVRNGKGTVIKTDFMTPIYVWLINFLATYICYAFGKFACKVMIQAFSFAFPVNLSVPVLLSGLIAICGQYNKDECSFTDTIPKYLFFAQPPLYFLDDFVSHQYAWIWLVWLLSQAWITVHIWAPNCEKLASTEKLFVRPLYDAFLIDQSLAMNRRRDEAPEYVDTSKDEIRDLDPLEINKDSITRVYACGTMWHETREEMLEFLKSIFRLDQDQCANRIVRNYLQLNLPSYYEFETHIFFDDAFVRTHQEDPDPHVNEFVQTLVSTIDEAATKVHGTEVRVRPPKIYPTPYGGRLVWTLPGKTKMIAHLKDKKKIRAKKRWSQVMYMYYLLGYGIMANDDIKLESKQTVSENTYILALDGDIDFQPEALQLLVDYMKKNKGLGAACGRIHPVGSGGMAWYQLFEYAVGHWMQKATEHVIGCVLCSPGCFSLFRSSALMDNAVMKKYTTKSSEAIHYVQFDQGEDRWLCTLLLQQGYRVEYSAASDAYTHCPEGFNEFYNQRRRWMPSTMANIMDLLMDYEHTVKANDNISMLYILYQVVLMIGTVIGPGTIFLMLVGAFVSAFGLDQWSSFFWNATPILVFIVVCATCNSDIQLFFAGLISAIYGLIMMAVFVGVMLQISNDGFLAPSSLFFFCMVGEFVISALLHPKEFYCLKYGIIYYVTVPSMYMLLVIYSVFNMNNVSWGTREVTVVPKPDPKAAKAQNKPKEEAPKKKENKIMSFLGASPNDNEGAIEFGLNKLFKCMFCTYRADPEEDKQLTAIQESIKALSKKLDDLERVSHPSEKFEPRMSMQPRLSRKPTMIEGSKARNSAQIQEAVFLEEDEENASLTGSASTEEVMENSWFYDGDLIRGEVHYLNKREETFWNDLLDEYLTPIEDDKEKVARELRDLRDKMVFSFLMINMLFVLVIFLLTLEKDKLHLNWPLEPKINFTYVYDKNEVHLYRDYLQLEPIGFVFLIAFASLLVVQFLAMLVHRFGTYSQILTNTNVDFDLFSTSIDNMTQDEIMAKDPLKMVKDLQKLRGINSNEGDDTDEPVQYRKTINNLIQEKQKRSGGIHDNDKAFHTRLKDIRENRNKGDVGDFRRKSVAFIDQRRQSLSRRASRLPPPNPEGFTHVLQDTINNDTPDSII